MGSYGYWWLLTWWFFVSNQAQGNFFTFSPQGNLTSLEYSTGGTKFFTPVSSIFRGLLKLRGPLPCGVHSPLRWAVFPFFSQTNRPTLFFREKLWISAWLKSATCESLCDFTFNFDSLACCLLHSSYHLLAFLKKPTWSTLLVNILIWHKKTQPP